MGTQSVWPGQFLVDKGEESVGIHFDHGGRGAAPVGRPALFGAQLDGGVRGDPQLDSLSGAPIGQAAGLGTYPCCEAGIDNSHRGRLS